ncbi:tyrosine-protein phosphatase non-receptor type 1 isoform X2 [Pseudomyrmex gracilis]|uniref:tyrosine-protein phosphatase non-receptor type 1 isoform X2 n=1 Tax=Pseudomyrmex gracilis TaxID=219809 RepID=UPI000994AC86|nr:tyrosine-protein phosphatase non-receptor type 1 isoform X2 [Pseudomyrmex gracilis]
MTSNEDTRSQAISNIETEYNEINSKNAWPIFFQHIRVDSSNEYSCIESKKPQNKNLNRYRDVVPYDHSRIILKRGTCDYIHANLIQVESANRKYILTQGPLPTTVGHFWLMVWEQNSRAVLMLNKVIEKNQIKCHQYFPLDEKWGPMIFEEVGIKVEFIVKIQSLEYTSRLLRITDMESNQSREVIHFHYTTWPDFGVPQCPTSFLRFLRDVRCTGALDQSVGPPIVHCSAGIGRSGTFCLVDSCLLLIEKQGLNSVNVREILLEMRQFRMGLIQTPEQLRFSYAAIIEGAKQLAVNNTIVNSKEPIDNDDNDDNDDEYDEMNNRKDLIDDEPPPLPPPRGASLTRSMMSDLSSDSSSSENDDVGAPPDKPLPSEPPNHTDVSADLKSTSITNNTYEQNANVTTSSNEDAEISLQTNNSNSEDKKSELRQRCRERNNRIAEQVREMKRRQKETEEWQKLKRSKSDTNESDESVHEETETTI